ncbi:tRNA nuclease CdiA-2 [Pandoraea captiosa]|uniref:tRNA nuclease CdiA-2 n=1 Tax=Pandoraea captiosa TaxID=2508302 RepID=A0A5E5AHQ7_9BURK|nr:tRNA nuclease CdiA-2 [Pandoraea captiosa]
MRCFQVCPVKYPTVTAPMPQACLPENVTALSADGQIQANNDLSLNFGSTATGGSILNTGSITSGGTLRVNSGTLGRMPLKDRLRGQGRARLVVGT